MTFASKLIGCLFFILFFLNGYYNTAYGQLTSSKLPIVVINTNSQTIVDDPKIQCDMGIIYNGPGATNNLTDPYNHYNYTIGIEIRGSSSSSFPQKSYGIETRSITGANLNFPVLGMPAENDWVLHAPYTDKSLLRNVLTYQLWNEMGHYGPRTRFCELVLNGNYRGVYVFIESVKKDPKRVNIATLNPTDITGDFLTGGYIIKIDKSTGGGTGWTSAYPSPTGSPIDILYHYPKSDEIAAVQQTYIQNYMALVENTLKSPTFTDPVNGYTKYMSINSFIDYLLINEISKNVDGYRISSFFNKDRDSRGGKLKAGPVWDYNIAWWNADYCNGNSYTGWAYDFPSVCPTDGYQVPFWWSRLMQDPNFVNQTRCRYEALRANVLAIPKLNTYIDKYVNDTLALPQARHFARWPILGTYVWPNPNTPATYAGEIANLKTWINNRLTWMDANLPGTCSVLPVNLLSFAGNRISNTKITLQWNTAHEINMNKFVIEKSFNHEDFEAIGEVPANNTTDHQQYTFEHTETKTALYRLKMIDHNGVRYSEIIDVEGEKNLFADLEVYPNPFTESITFGYSILQPTELVIELIDIRGKSLESFTSSHAEKGKFIHQIKNLSGYPSGTYLLKIRSQETILYAKLVKL